MSSKNVLTGGKTYFPEVEFVPFEGKDSDNPFAFKYYNPAQLISGKTMADHFRFAIAYWHSFCGNGSDPFGMPTRNMPWLSANNQLDRAINLLQGKDLPGMEGDVSATGLKGYLPTGMLNRLDPQGVSTRAEIADIGSLKLHDRSGAAVTASESPRLMPFIPLATDDAVTALKKLQRLKLEVNNETSAMRDIYSKDQGYKENPILNKPSVSEKITTMQEIKDVAAKTRKTVDEVKKDAEAKGYKVNQ